MLTGMKRTGRDYESSVSLQLKMLPQSAGGLTTCKS